MIMNVHISYQAPFQLEMSALSMAIMDIHSHLSKTEVIGLLGGRFIKEQGKLVVMMAEPCHSLSTGMQCEMDPGECAKICHISRQCVIIN